MAAYINTNISSLFAQKALNKSQDALQVSMQRLSSGMRINSAQDDATGLVSATVLDTALRGTNQAIRNLHDGIAASQTNDGYAAQVTENLQRLSEISVQLGGTAAGVEATALVTENTRILGLMNTAAGTVVNSSAGTTYTTTGIAPTIVAGLTTAALATALTAVNTQRANYGADMAVMTSAANNLSVASVNIAGQKSRIMDTDYASESAIMTKNNILQQAGTAMLAQANQQPNTVMTLLR